MDLLTAPQRRLAVVVQRFGPGIAGGAEWHARELVTALARHHEVTVLTSCALDAMTWDLHFAPGPGRIELPGAAGGAAVNVAIERFAHPPRHAGGRARVPRRHKLRWGLRRLFDALGHPRVPRPTGDAAADGHLFLRRQGPACDGLIQRLRGAAAEFDAVVFFTALYFPTAEGLPAWGRRSVLIPTLHDEKPMHLPCYHALFANAGVTLYNSAAERRLARRLYGASAQDGPVVGVGVQVQAPTAGAVAAARARHRLPERYLVYVGRVEKGKGCAALLAAWQAVAAQVPDAALVFVGKGDLSIPETGQVRATGFVEGAERDALVAGAAALVMPSAHESLSLVLLEALALGVPVLANGASEVLAGHVHDSGAGTVYRGAAGLRRGLLEALARDDAQRARLGAAGRRYVAERYAWPRVHAQWLAAVEKVAARPARPVTL
jgi:glycosyltransferase involved in cell wall biosynthesis